MSGPPKHHYPHYSLQITVAVSTNKLQPSVPAYLPEPLVNLVHHLPPFNPTPFSAPFTLAPSLTLSPSQHPHPTLFQIALAVSTNKLRPSVPAYLPEPLVALCNKCCAFEPAERPSFAQVVVALDGVIRDLKQRVGDARAFSSDLHDLHHHHIIISSSPSAACTGLLRTLHARCIPCPRLVSDCKKSQP